ncbi:5-hydroxytryptamine receptor 1F [Sardina pilchardus]|uniref:5-hydroxytryptamine receptor 1F n=1 Tax=Sardina pilchardus TaxID=27697 RepID=UPI002E0F34AC
MDPAPSSPEQLRSSDPQTTFDLGKVLLAVALSVLAVASAAVNALVITSILATRKLRSPANFLICSLALTDLLVSVLVMPVSIVSLTAADGRWRLGAALCHLWLGLDVVCCTCSILHLAAIALDRYRAITDAVAYAQKRTARHALLTVAAVWLLSVLVSLPPLVWRKQDDAADEDGPTMCIIEHDHVAFTVYSTFGAFYVPLLLILVLYYRIYRAAQTLQNRRGSRRPCLTVSSAVLPGEGSGSGALSPVTLSPTDRSFSELSYEGDRTCVAAGPRRAPPLRPPCRPSGAARERRAALTLGLILGAFVVCWLPFFLKEVIANSCPSCHTPAALADGLTWLGYLNSLINPLIYTVFNQDFKKAFKRLLAIPCAHHR